MITPFAILQAFIAGFSFSGCILVIIYIWARKQLQPFWPLVLFSFILSVFSISKLLLNSTTDVASAVEYYRIMSVCITVLLMLVPVFYKRVFSEKIGIYEYIIFFVYTIYGIGNLVSPIPLDYSATAPMMQMDLGFLGKIYTIINWKITPIAAIIIFADLIVIIYCLLIAYNGVKKGIREGRFLIYLSIIILFYMAYHICVAVKLFTGPGFMEFNGFIINLSVGLIVFSRERNLLAEMKSREEKLFWAGEEIKNINDRLQQTNKDLNSQIIIRNNIEKSLRESEERYKGITNNIPGFIYQYYETDNGERGFCYVDKRSYEMFEIENDPIDTWFERFTACLTPDDKERLLKSMYWDNKNDGTWSFELNFIKPSGRPIAIKAISQLVKLENKNLWNGLVLDVTEQKISEERIKKSEHIFSTIFNKSPMAMAIIDLKTKCFREVNSSWLEITGYTKEECINKPSMELGLWVYPEQQMEFVSIIIKTGHVKNFEFVSRKKNGEILIAVMNSEIIYLSGEPAILTITEDITKRKNDEKALKKSLTEKETLLRELYHRTKNNMQIICSLLELQAGSLDDPELNKILMETENRIKTMALLHQKLYQSKDLSLIDLKEYTIELVDILSRLYTVKTDKIHIEMEFDEIYILIDYGVTIGLIINEIVSNAFKYAFPADTEGRFFIKMLKNDNKITMIMCDNGVGFREDEVNLKDPQTLGLQLIQSLVTDQLNGYLKIEHRKGVKYTIVFTDDQYEKRL